MLPRRLGFGRKWSRLVRPLALLGSGMLLQLGVVPAAHSATPPPPAVRFTISGSVNAALTLKRFTATGRRRSVVLKWETANERNTRLFRLWRSSTGSRYDAVLATNVFARGANGKPAAYTYVDGGIQPGGVYTYFLEEQRTDGSSKQIGSVSASAPLNFGVER